MVKSYQKGISEKVSDFLNSTQLDCPCFNEDCKVTLIDEDLLMGLDELADKAGALIITSGFRCAEHNKSVGGAPSSQHLVGKAVDILGGMDLKKAAEQIGCFATGGIGLYNDHLHVDTRGTPARW